MQCNKQRPRRRNPQEVTEQPGEQLPLENPSTENSLKLQNFSLTSGFLSLHSPKITYFQGETRSRYSPAWQDTFQTSQLSVCRSTSILRRKDDSDLQIPLTPIQQTREVKQTQSYSRLEQHIFSWSTLLWILWICFYHNLLRTYLNTCKCPDMHSLVVKKNVRLTPLEV